MKKLWPALISAALVGCAYLPLPRSVNNGHLTAYVPFGFFSHVDENGWINISMPEVTNGVSIERISTAEDFQQRAQRDIELTRKVYPAEWVLISEIKVLGHLKGAGYKIIVNQFKADRESGEESYLFMTESDGLWLVSAASLSGDKSSWRKILDSLRYKNTPNQALQTTTMTLGKRQ